MATYSVQLINKQVVSVKKSDGETVPVDTILEKTTGETIWATIEAGSDEEAKEKAEKVAVELQSRETKKALDNSH